MTTLPAPPLKPVGTARQGWGLTSRLDNWASAPTLQAFVFTICATYLVVSGIIWNPLFGTPYDVDGYLSPLFSPLIVWPDMPAWLSPGLLILWIPIGFRATCYYYRKAYYRFYFSDPPGCAVGEPRVLKHFATENAFPFILQNIHRYFLYLAFIPLAFLWIDVVRAFAPEGSLRIGFGGVLFFVNVTLLTGYSLSCHSLRHVVGGKLDCFSCTRRERARYEAWRWLSFLNRHHMAFAWASLLTVTLADLYVRFLALGLFADPAIRF
ncbi:MAG TPA: succinate dehydrogenase [Candidatus Polarisedimenticolia bacterium]|nr:succinate dehydrogenase [Candidatus Polarisedimenticolia bacterium]